MPEGDAVWRTARRLDRALAGQVLTRTDLRVPRWATVDLAGETVEGTTTYGKHLLTRIGADWTLHTHLRMDGSWIALPARGRWTRPAHTVRVQLATETTQAIGVLLGVVELLPRSQEATAYAHLGPDVLSPDWDDDALADAVRRLAGHPDALVFDALRDQTSLAGLGTIWAAESCFALGLDPRTPVATVDERGRLPRLVQVARLKLRDAIRGRGPEPYAVYGRERQPCPRCGSPVRRIAMGAEGRPRPAYFCPHCQPRL
ncbi:MAG: DNA-formamidopyrimidine glycosylase family protein [Nocardioides sp.]|uniref:DNA-formamidopyrimidine glycosylase family protein n=1 Tax=Nocardioides sp. TaxID=35761 RepID=UPI0039E23EC3